jgi:hypothetical protein
MNLEGNSHGLIHSEVSLRLLLGGNNENSGTLKIKHRRRAIFGSKSEPDG